MTTARPNRRHRVAHCRRCGTGPLATHGTIIRNRLRGHSESPRRGLCASCTHWVLKLGELHKYPPLLHPLQQTVSLYQTLRRQYPDETDADIARRMDMALAALKKAKNRARKRGLLPPYGGNHAR